MTSQVIYIPSENGERKPYKLFSARLPEFLEKYPVKDGYRVIVTNTDYIQVQNTLVELYKMAIQGGLNPVELGLPALADSNAYLFTARLLGPEDVLLGSASAVKVIFNAKDWEIGETAARQRLVASLGFGGDCFDNDEIGDLASRNIIVKPPSDEESATEQVTDQKQNDSSDDGQDAIVEKVVAKPEQAEPIVSDLVSSTPPAKKDNAAKSASSAAPRSTVKEAPKEKTSTVPAEEIPTRILRQLEHQANLRGVDVPKVNTIIEAKAALKQLMQNK